MVACRKSLYATYCLCDFNFNSFDKQEIKEITPDYEQQLRDFQTAANGSDDDFFRILPRIPEKFQQTLFGIRNFNKKREFDLIDLNKKIELEKKRKLEEKEKELEERKHEEGKELDKRKHEEGKELDKRRYEDKQKTIEHDRKQIGKTERFYKDGNVTVKRWNGKKWEDLGTYPQFYKDTTKIIKNGMKDLIEIGKLGNKQSPTKPFAK